MFVDIVLEMGIRGQEGWKRRIRGEERKVRLSIFELQGLHQATPEALPDREARVSLKESSGGD